MRRIIIGFATLLLIGLPFTTLAQAQRSSKAQCYALALSSGDETAAY
jgi:hypothetical protein